MSIKAKIAGAMVAAALAGSGITMAGYAIADGNRMATCKANVNSTRVAQGLQPLDQETVDKACTKGSIVIVKR